MNVNMNANGFGAEYRARLFLFIACFWPLWVLVLFASSKNPNQGGQLAHSIVHSPREVLSNARLNLRSVMDRVDIMGYGPTHPRVAVVVTAEGEEEDRERVISSVESIFSNTDINRIFLVCVVMDGHSRDEKLVEELEKIDSGLVPHWHGLRQDIHMPGARSGQDGDGDGDESDPHGRKIHVMFNTQRNGVAASRLDAVQFLKVLESKHESAGLKSEDEDLLLLFLRAGAQLIDSNWLKAVTSALIVPPPIVPKSNDEETNSVAMKLANAVSFRLEDPGKRTSFDQRMIPIVSEATASDINLSSGRSYPTPAVNGAATAMRLNVFLELPAQDISLRDPWLADLELALNFWLCADGIDIIENAEVISFGESTTTHVKSEDVARFAAVWMDDAFASKFLHAHSPQITRLDWETKMTHARHLPTFPKGMATKCRSFEWYATEINTDLAGVLEQGASEHTTVHKAETEAKHLEKRPVDATVHSAVPHNDAAINSPRKEVEDEKSDDVIPDLARNHRKKPSIPLRDENLKIVQRAKPVDISFVDVSGGNKEHPHMGAKDANGNWGYIHDETALRENPPAFVFEDEEQKAGCTKRDNNYRMLTERVFVDVEYDKKAGESGSRRDKIFCLVYTIESGHPKIHNIRETWGPKCDGFMVGSTKTDPSIGAVEIPHEGPEEYNNIWQKVRSMWSYIYDNYYEKYDWFHIGGDDLFLLIENLRYYLESEEIQTAANGGVYLPDGTETSQTPLLLGRRFAYLGDMNDIFDSGGSGYTMNKAALKTLVVEGFPNYFPHAHTFSEDTMVAKVLRKFNVFPYDTKDDEGSERYMPFMPGHHWGYRLPKDPSKDWYAKYSINIKEGPEHSSKRSVAFHYVKGDAMKRLFALSYGLCPKEYLN